MISILIVNWNTRELLRACLNSIFANAPAVEMEVIVVDNASKDRSSDMVANSFPNVLLVNPGKNTGYAAGNNLAFERAKGEWLLTLNPDTEVLPGTLDRAIESLTNHPDYGALGIAQIGVDGTVQSSVRGFPSFMGVFGDLTGLGKLFKKSRFDSYRLRSFDYTKEQPAPQPMGTFLLFRRAALEAIGDPKKPFDEGFPIFFNEVDLLYRMNKSGWPCLYDPSVEIKHLGGESTKQVKKSMIWESHKSLARFFEKHYRTPLTAPFLPLFRGLVLCAAWVRAKGYDVGFQG
ncbi:MAG TPA: glycosyltransferase family 2 protein [Fimbriimonadaceae bacterium]|jgi:hypothetical protein